MPNPATATATVDVRAPRFIAWITTVVLAAALLLATVSTMAAALVVGVQAAIFAIGAVAGPRRSPYGRVFATLVAPRLSPVTDREPVAPLVFAQTLGLVFAVIGTVGFAAGWIAVGLTATAFALVAAFLNAAFGICLGCLLYPLVVRLRRPSSSA